MESYPGVIPCLTWRNFLSGPCHGLCEVTRSHRKSPGEKVRNSSVNCEVGCTHGGCWAGGLWNGLTEAHGNSLQTLMNSVLPLLRTGASGRSPHVQIRRLGQGQGESLAGCILRKLTRKLTFPCGSFPLSVRWPMFLVQGPVLRNQARTRGIVGKYKEGVMSQGCPWHWIPPPPVLHGRGFLHENSLVSGSMLWGNWYIFQGLRLNLQQSMSQ